MKKIQRIISFLLALVMIIGEVSPIEVRAEETDPTQAVMEVTEETTVPAEPETEAAEETKVPTDTAAEQAEVTAASNDLFIEMLVESSFSEAVNETLTNEAIDSGSCGENLSWSLLDGVLTISGEGAMYDYTYTEDDENGDVWTAPWLGLPFTSVVVDEGVTYIGDNAFYRNSLVRDPLETVVLADSVTAVGDYAFYCTEADITMSRNLTSVGQYGFYACSVDQMYQIVDVGRYGFANASFETGNIQAGRTSAFSFASCKGLDTVIFYQNPGSFSFQFADLKRMIVTDDVTVIGEEAFWYCKKLEEIYYCCDCPEIQLSAYAHTPDTMSVYRSSAATGFDDSVAVWPDEAHAQVKGEYVKATCTESGYTVYRCAYCDFSIKQEDGSVGDHIYGENHQCSCGAIGGTCGENLTWTLLDGVLTISGEGLMPDYSSGGAPWYQYRGDINSVVIESGVIKIGQYAFEECAMSSLTLPESVIQIADPAFVDCNELTDVYISDIAAWVGLRTNNSTDHPLRCNQNEKNLYLNGDLLTDAVIPEGVTAIGSGSFYKCTNLRSVTLPASVTTLRYNVFSGCTNLRDVYIEDLTAWLNLDFMSDNPLNSNSEPKNLYLNGELLTDIVIPDGITQIGDYAFFSCSNIRSITFPEGIELIGFNSFAGCSGLSSIILPDSVTYIDVEAFSGCSSLSSIVLPENLSVIEKVAFSDCSSLTEITIPANVTAIWDYAFRDCTGLSRITFEGDAPEFPVEVLPGYSKDSEAFSNVVATAYYPANNYTWTADVLQNYGGNITWVAYEPEIEKIVLSGTAMTLGNSLSMDFGINTANLVNNGEGHYALITKYYADGREPVVTRVDRADWKSYSGSVYTASCTGIAAKEMCDEVEIVVYNADGYAVTNTYTDSVKSYAMRTLNNTNNQSKTELLTTIVDMLNYGAAAQQVFGYDTANLANADLTEAQKAMATAEINPSDARVKGPGYAGSTLTLESQILLDFVFFDSTIGTDFTGMYAIATYTDHYGNAKEVRMDEFKVYASGYHYVSVSGMAVADCSQLVTCTVYNSNGDAIASASDSVEGYIARQLASGKTDAIYTAILKFAASAYNYFH